MIGNMPASSIGSAKRTTRSKPSDSKGRKPTPRELVECVISAAKG